MECALFVIVTAHYNLTFQILWTYW